MKRLAGLVLALAIASVAAAVPQVLIAQLPSTRKADKAKEKPADMLFEMGNLLAQEIETQGKLIPIVWGQSDPMFRAATADGLIKNPPPIPNLEQAQAAQRVLKAEYLILVIADIDGDTVKASIRLFSGGRQVWTDTQAMASTLGGLTDSYNALRSIARTWVVKMDGGPLRSLPAAVRHQTPAPEPGIVPKVASTPVKEPEAAPTRDLKSLLVDTNYLMKAGQAAQAIGLLRDAVDAGPFDADLRVALVQALLRNGLIEMAANEARRALQVAPGSIELRLLAAKAWIQLGRPEEAQEDLNEAIARDPRGATAREQLGEVSLYKLNALAAIEHLTAALEERPSAETRFVRCVAYTVLGQTEAASKDFEAASGAPGLDPAQATARHLFVSEILQRSVDKSGDQLIQLMNRSKTGGDPAVGADADGFLRRARAAVTLLERLTPDESHRKSHERRLLAFKLLALSMNDLLSYLRARNEDILSDSRLNLGEAMRQFASAREEMRKEVEARLSNGKPSIGQP